MQLMVLNKTNASEDSDIRLLGLQVYRLQLSEFNSLKEGLFASKIKIPIGSL